MAKSPARQKHPYPYSIPEVKCPDADVLKALHSAQILEFFRIEALLRSSSVQHLYHECKMTSGRMAERPLFTRYGICWDVLDGAHHQLLTPDPMFIKPPWFPPLPTSQPELLARAGVIDIGASAKEGHAHAWSYLMQDSNPRFLFLAIDTMTKAETIITALRPILQERNAQTEQAPPIDTVFVRDGMISDDSDDDVSPSFTQPHNAFKNSPIRDVKNWLDYFTCYDLQHCEGLLYGEIAKRVYERGQTLNLDKAERVRLRERNRDRAEKAVLRTDHLIKQAENNIWPPDIR